MPEVFVDISFGDIPAQIVSAWEQDDAGKAKELADKVLTTETQIKGLISTVGGKVVLDNMAHFMVWLPMDEELIEALNDIHVEVFGTSTNLGVGRTPAEAWGSIQSINDTPNAKGNVVVSGRIEEDLAFNRSFYRTAVKTQMDLNFDEVIKRAFLELNIITTDDKVCDVFIELVKKNSLFTLDDLKKFFYRPLEELKDEIRDVYKSTKTASILPNDDAKHAPGQSNVVRPRRQQSPHKRMTWLTTEQMNEDKGIDYRKTDVQYVGGNQTGDSQQFSMGGEPGNAIAVD